MLFTYDRYKNLETPRVFLAYPNKRVICSLNVYELETTLSFNNISSGSLKIYRYENNQEITHYDKIQIGMFIEVQYVSWFKIRDIESGKDENGTEYLKVEFASIESMLCNTNLTSFGSLGVESDAQGGLDRYCLKNDDDKAHSIAHIFMEKNPSWYFKYVDPMISTQYRSFDIDSISSYEFLVKNVSAVYECIFLFDTYDMSVSAYRLDNIGTVTSIFLSDRNFIKSVTTKSSDADIKTVFYVSGGNNAKTNSTLGIIEVNPSGNNMISNFDYFKDQMSDELKNKLEDYYVVYAESEKNYIKASNERDILYTRLSELQSKSPDNSDSTDWTLYGLNELELKEALYWTNMSSNLDAYTSYTNAYSLYSKAETVEEKNKYEALYKQYESGYENYTINCGLHEEVKTAIALRKEQISDIEAAINKKTNEINDYIINIHEYLGDDLYKELSCFVMEQDFQDDSFIVTTEMNENEILDMQYELMEHARNELAKVCYPQFDMTINSINFTTRKEFAEYTEQLELGNIITIEWEPGVLIEVRLLEMQIDWFNLDNFTLKFSSKKLENKWAVLAEIQRQANATASTVDYNKGAWNVAKQTSLDFLQWKSNLLDTSLQKLQNSANQEMLIDETGILLRKWLSDRNKHSDNQVWMTNGQIAFTRDAWKSVCTALGELTLPDGQIVYGLNAEYIIGELLVGETLRLRGSGTELDLKANDAIMGLNTSFNVQNGIIEAYIGSINEDGSVTENGSIYTKFRQTDNNIALKVGKSDVINAINEIDVNETGVKIKASQIDIEGITTFKTMQDKITGLETGTTTINGGCIKTGTLDANNVNVINLVADKIDCGNGYLVASSGNVNLGNLKIYDNGKSTYLAFSDDVNWFGLGNGAGSHFWSNWGKRNDYGIYGSAEFQVSTDGTMYVSAACIGSITPRFNNILTVNGDLWTPEGYLSDLWKAMNKLSETVNTPIDLSGYVTTTKLDETLSSYVATSALSSYAKADDLNNTNDRLNNYMSANNSDVESNSSRIDAAESDIDKLQSRLSIAEKQLESLLERLGTLEDNFYTNE